MRRLSILLFALTLVAAGCGGDEPALQAPTPTDTDELIDEGAAAVEDEICGAQQEVAAILDDVEGGAVESQDDVVRELDDLQSRLEDAAGDLDDQQAAAAVSRLADAVAELQQGIESQDPEDIGSAAASVAQAIQDLPGCPAA